MPYYIYRITPGPTTLMKQLECINEFEDYKESKNLAKQLRSEQASDDASSIKVIFADNKLEAEERLQEKRDAPIMREWEK